MKQVLLDLVRSIRSTDLLSLIFAVLMLSRAVGFIYIPEVFGYAVMFAMALYCMTKYESIDKLIVAMLIYFTLNIVLESPPSEFRSWARLGVFVLLLLCTTPLLHGRTLSKVRKQVFYAVMWLASVLSVLTFFCYFLGINYMYISADVSIYNTAGVFGGLFNQSMMMGPVAGGCAVFLSYQYFTTKNKWYLVFAICCIGAVFLSASRSSFMCTFAGILVMLYKATGGQTRFIKVLTIVALIASLTFPLWGTITDGLVSKQANNIEAGSTFSSRENKWDARIAEFESSPLLGIGFASIDGRLDDVGGGGVVEPGSSWLAVLSMTGLIGFFFFFSVIFTCYKYCNKMREQEDALLLGLLALFAVHMIAEGYVFAAGGFLCFFLWMVIGACYDRKYA